MVSCQTYVNIDHSACRILSGNNPLSIFSCIFIRLRMWSIVSISTNSTFSSKCRPLHLQDQQLIALFFKSTPTCSCSSTIILIIVVVCWSCWVEAPQWTAIGRLQHHAMPQNIFHQKWRNQQTNSYSKHFYKIGAKIMWWDLYHQITMARDK